MKTAPIVAAVAALLAGCTSTVAQRELVATEDQKIAPGFTPPAEPVATDLRRTTLIVRDINASIALYRDVIGLQLQYVTDSTMTGKAIPAGGAGDKAKFALLSANDPWVGMIGLLQWTDPELPDPGPYPTRMAPGGVVLVMNTTGVDERCAAAAKVPGVTVNAAIHDQFFPSRNGSGELHIRGCTFFDPDGNLIEINQIVD